MMGLIFSQNGGRLASALRGTYSARNGQQAIVLLRRGVEPRILRRMLFWSRLTLSGLSPKGGMHGTGIYESTVGRERDTGAMV
jgi:hypothetical protein